MKSGVRISYLGEGMPPGLARKYTSEATVKTLGNNVGNEKTKLILAAGNFSTVQEALKKFVTVDTPQTQASVLLHEGNRQF